MTISVRFLLSYDPFKMGFYRLQNEIVSERKCIVDTDVVNDVMCMAKVLLHMWSYHFYDTTFSTE